MNCFEFNIDPNLTWEKALDFVSNDNFFLVFNEGKILFGWDVNQSIIAANQSTQIQSINHFLEKNKGQYIFSCLTYDLKNQFFRNLKSENEVLFDFPDFVFCTFKNLLIWQNDSLTYKGYLDTELIEKKISATSAAREKKIENSVNLKPIVSQSTYLNNVNKIKRHIQLGDIYEMNYCIPFVSINTQINPIETFINLYQRTTPPHAAFVNWNNQFILSASPERFLKKENNKIISQPIKGTARRDYDEARDNALKQELSTNSKERSENIMIVDLVRNDLSKIASKNSVQVDELCGVHTFKTVHQLISTVSCDLKKDIDFVSILEATFPMGSMTGAPKLSALKFAEEFEDFKRGIYSGSIGVIFPNGDFDFNVVIRSILYSRDKQVVSCAVGGAITIESEPEKEYEECLLKLKALQESL